MSFDYKRLVKFEHNIGAKDKKVRMVSGLVLAFVSLFLGSVFLLLVGGVLIATSYFGWCPGYSSCNFNSLGAEQAQGTSGEADSH
jgi:hypothetical protein